MNPRVRALGETVLRVKDLERVKRLYTDVIGLDVLREFVPFPNDPRDPVHLEATSLHHFALEIDKGDFHAELDRLTGLKSPRVNTGGVVGGHSMSATRRGIPLSSCAMTRRSSKQSNSAGYQGRGECDA